MSNPWDLNTALNNSTVSAGDTIWLHGGLYNGRYSSTISGTAGIGNEITVSSFLGEWAVLNGNVPSTLSQVLVILGGHVIYKNFEVTFQGSFNRTNQDVGGINHDEGEDCKLINLIVHDNPGNGIESWKLTGGTEIYGCLIYNNGYDGTKGTGIYIQNESDKVRKIYNNVLFNNFKHGVKLWTETTEPSPTDDFVKNLDINDNVIFNTGSPLGNGQECLILASRCKIAGANIINNVNVKNNFLAHNFNNSWTGNVQEAFRINEKYDDYSNVDLAYNITVEDNYFLGGKQGVFFASVSQDFSFKRNISLTNYVYSYNNYYSNTEGDNNFVNWDFSDNYYFTKFHQSYHLMDYATVNGGTGKKTLQFMETQFGMENMSSADYNNSEPIDNSVLTNHIGTNKTILLTQNKYVSNQFKVVVFDKDSNDVDVDFSNYNIASGIYYTIRDTENYFDIVSTNALISNNIITLPIDLTTLHTPSGIYNDNGASPKKSDSIYGAFIVEFICQPNLVLQDITEMGIVEHQSGETITVAGSSSTHYTIKPNAEVIHKAGEKITLKSGFHAESGSIYNASIEYCALEIDYVGENNSGSSSRMADSNTINNITVKEEAEIVKIYPNPSNKLITIESVEDMISWELKDHFGKFNISSKNNHKSFTNDQLNISRLPIGIYVLKITLANGEVFYKNIIKD
ncbi:MAG: T9SS type A sorting domain-containing protein [bacterium]|nr:T9SS type A sorting domain-containing protein [bacterium]